MTEFLNVRSEGLSDGLRLGLARGLGYSDGRNQSRTNLPLEPDEMVAYQEGLEQAAKDMARVAFAA